MRVRAHRPQTDAREKPTSIPSFHHERQSGGRGTDFHRRRRPPSENRPKRRPGTLGACWNHVGTPLDPRWRRARFASDPCGKHAGSAQDRAGFPLETRHRRVKSVRYHGFSGPAQQQSHHPWKDAMMKPPPPRAPTLNGNAARKQEECPVPAGTGRPSCATAPRRGVRTLPRSSDRSEGRTCLRLPQCLATSCGGCRLRGDGLWSSARTMTSWEPRPTALHEGPFDRTAHS